MEKVLREFTKFERHFFLQKETVCRAKTLLCRIINKGVVDQVNDLRRYAWVSMLLAVKFYEYYYMDPGIIAKLIPCTLQEVFNLEIYILKLLNYDFLNNNIYN